ncbi:MAG: NAD/NADP octopine/nopaline dehydrogenase family protein [Thermodesulfobacteriota bacterium]
MKIAVIGAGHAGYSIASLFVLRGHELILYEMPSFKQNLDPIIERGGIELSGVAEQGFARINKVTTDMGEAIKGVKVIIVCTVSNVHNLIAELCAPHLEDGQIILLLAGYVGSLEFANVLKKKDPKILKEKDIKIAETEGQPFGCRRVIGQAKTTILFAGQRHLAAFPAKHTQKVLDDLKEIFDFHPGRNVIEVGLSNPNICGHVVGTILNTGYIEVSEGKFKLWKQGMSPSVLRGIETVWKEKTDIFNKLGGYTDHYTFEKLKRAIDNHILDEGWGPTDMKFRYITEDTPNGMVSLASLGDMIGVPTPVIKAFITIASMINRTDYWREGRTVERLGISRMSVDKLNKFLEEGE